MAKLQISANDMAKGIPAAEGWYKGKLLSFTQEMNSKKDGINYVPVIEFEGKDGVTRECKSWFSSKALGIDFARFYCAATDQKLVATENLEIDTDEIKKGIELWIHIAQDVYNGRIINKMDNYLTASEEVPF